MPTVEKLAYRVPEAADAIGYSRAKTYELVAAGVLPSIRIGGSIRVPVDGLRAWVNAHTTGGAQTAAGTEAAGHTQTARGARTPEGSTEGAK